MFFQALKVQILLEQNSINGMGKLSVVNSAAHSGSDPPLLSVLAKHTTASREAWFQCVSIRKYSCTIKNNLQ